MTKQSRPLTTVQVPVGTDTKARGLAAEWIASRDSAREVFGFNVQEASRAATLPSDQADVIDHRIEASNDGAMDRMEKADAALIALVLHRTGSAMPPADHDYRLGWPGAALVIDSSLWVVSSTPDDARTAVSLTRVPLDHAAG